MRTIVLIIVMLAVAGGGFYFLALRDRPAAIVGPAATQPNGGAQAKPAPYVVPTSTPTNTSADASLVGESQRPYFESRDPRTNRITRKVRAESLVPHHDGTVGLVKPRLIFYGKDKANRIVLEGSDGNITTAAGGNPNDPRAIGAAKPTNGTLNNVTLRVYDAPTDPALIDDDDRLLATPAQVTVTIPATIHFDADANRVTTVDSTIDGKTVPAERVPIHVRGDAFELDGEGLTLQWDDRSGRLDTLVIERGDRLLVKDVSRFSGASLLGQAPLLPFLDAPLARRDDPATPAFTFDSLFDGIVAVGAPATAPTTSPAKKPDLYHATFDRDVHVTRAGEEVAVADVMRVVLTLDNSDSSKSAQPQPSTRPTAEPAGTTNGTTEPRRRRPAAERPTTNHPSPQPTETADGSNPSTIEPLNTPATAPTTAPAPVPLEVHWSGPLTIRPAATISAALTSQMVELTGKPAWVRDHGSEARGATIHVEPDTGKMRILPGDGVPQIQVNDSAGGHLTSTAELSVDRSVGTVDVGGAGMLDVPPGATPTLSNAPANKPAAPTTAPASTQPTIVHWTRHLHVDTDTPTNGDANAKPFLKQITIEGDADVHSATVRAQAQMLTLAFTEPTPSAQPAAPAKPDAGGFTMPAADFTHLRTITADGAAHLVTVDASSSREQTLDANRVRLDFKPGANGPAITSLASDGNVALHNADNSSLTCGTLDVQLDPNVVPTTMPATGDAQLAQIRRLIAKDNVHLTQADGSRASADRVELGGAPTALSARSTRRFKLTGQPAVVANDRGELRGATIELEPNSGSVAVPGPGTFNGTGGGTMALAWTGSMTADGDGGVCTMNDDVHIDSTDAHGTRLTTVARSAVVRFVPSPPQQQQQTSGATTRSTSASASMSRVSLDSVTSLQLVDMDRLTMLSGDGRRETQVETPALAIDLVGGTVVAPQAGRMLMIERSATTRPSTQPTTDPASMPATMQTAAASPATQPGDATEGQQKGGGFGAGTLALAWTEATNWRLREGDCLMTGGVRLGYAKEGVDDVTRVTANRLRCGLTPIDPQTATHRPTTQPVNGVDELAQHVELKTVNALGNVSVRSKLTSLNAGTLRYDLLSDEATAAADDQSPLEVFDASGASQMGFSSFTWNVNTGMGTFNNVGAQIRRK